MNSCSRDAGAADVLTHLDAQGHVHMVDVGEKDTTNRRAQARGSILMQAHTQELIMSGQAAKGDVLACARVAAIMAAKHTSDLIPLCHPLPIHSIAVDIDPIDAQSRPDGRSGFCVQATLGVSGKTGIEMEALTAVSVACLTIYDMCKAVDRGMEITDIHLVFKEGGRSGLWKRDDDFCQEQ